MEKRNSNKKGFLQISFSWLFAIIAGAFILFLVIFVASKIIDRGEDFQSIKTSEKIGILTNPLEIGAETNKLNSISFPVLTRIYGGCENTGYFGNQLISTAQEGFNNRWDKTSLDLKFSNKYFFMEEPVEGKTFYFFTKPFEFPYKIADLTYFFSKEKKYCFEEVPEEVKEELESINLQGQDSKEIIKIENCSSEDTKICFESKSSCDMVVNYQGKYIKKEGDLIYFEGDALMFAGIFSNKETYECQLGRIFKRGSLLGELYLEKAVIVSQENCNTNLNLELEEFIRDAKNLKSSKDLRILKDLGETIQEKNSLNGECKLW